MTTVRQFEERSGWRVVYAIQFDGTNLRDIWAAFGNTHIFGPTVQGRYDRLTVICKFGYPVGAIIGDWVTMELGTHVFDVWPPLKFQDNYKEVE